MQYFKKLLNLKLPTVLVKDRQSWIVQEYFTKIVIVVERANTTGAETNNEFWFNDCCRKCNGHH